MFAAGPLMGGDGSTGGPQGCPSEKRLAPSGHTIWLIHRVRVK